VCVRARARVRACVRACMRALYVHVHTHTHTHTHIYILYIYIYIYYIQTHAHERPTKTRSCTFTQAPQATLSHKPITQTTRPSSAQSSTNRAYGSRIVNTYMNSGISRRPGTREEPRRASLRPDFRNPDRNAAVSRNESATAFTHIRRESGKAVMGIEPRSAGYASMGGAHGQHTSSRRPLRMHSDYVVGSRNLSYGSSTARYGSVDVGNRSDIGGNITPKSVLFRGNSAAKWLQRHVLRDELKDDNGDMRTCIICLDGLHLGEEVCCLMGCAHTYHWKCIHEWVMRCVFPSNVAKNKYSVTRDRDPMSAYDFFVVCIYFVCLCMSAVYAYAFGCECVHF
jgi:hypothetical protein